MFTDEHLGQKICPTELPVTWRRQIQQINVIMKIAMTGISLKVEGENSSHKLSSAFHVCTVASVHIHCTNEINVKEKEYDKTLW